MTTIREREKANCRVYRLPNLTLEKAEKKKEKRMNYQYMCLIPSEIIPYSGSFRSQSSSPQQLGRFSHYSLIMLVTQLSCLNCSLQSQLHLIAFGLANASLG